MFHHFHKNEKEKFGQGSINSREFEKIIKYLKKNYEILNPDEWIYKLEKNKLKKKNICITFDDALYSQYKIGLKVLNKYKLKAFWFIYSSVFSGKLDEFEIHRKFRSVYFDDFEDFYYEFSKYIKNITDCFNDHKYRKFYLDKKKFFSMYSDKDIKFRFLRDCVLTRSQFNKIILKMMNEKQTSKLKLSKGLWLKNHHLKKLSKDGHHICMHAYNHPYEMSKLSYENQWKELKRNFYHIKNTINKIPISISYPNGSFNNNTLKIIKELGIKCGFISSMKNYRKLKQKKYLLKRLDHSVLLKNIIK